MEFIVLALILFSIIQFVRTTTLKTQYKKIDEEQGRLFLKIKIVEKLDEKQNKLFLKVRALEKAIERNLNSLSTITDATDTSEKTSESLNTSMDISMDTALEDAIHDLDSIDLDEQSQKSVNTSSDTIIDIDNTISTSQQALPKTSSPSEESTQVDDKHNKLFLKAKVLEKAIEDNLNSLATAIDATETSELQKTESFATEITSAEAIGSTSRIDYENMLIQENASEDARREAVITQQLHNQSPTYSQSSQQTSSDYATTSHNNSNNNAEITKVLRDSNTKRKEQTTDYIGNALSYAKEWFTTGNVIVKIGMVVIFFAVIALLRYATAQGWLHVPMEYRLLGIAGGAIGALVFAWTKRESKRSFSLSVQGGSIGILLLDIFASVKMYNFITPEIGFALSVLAVFLASVLAIKQDSKALIIMAIFAGFLAPIWLSDGSGNHVILFSYYAILNAGIFIVSWHKNWRELNMLGFFFTYIIGSTWGGLKYSEENFASTEPFVLLFFLFYLIIPLRLHAQNIEAQENSEEDDDLTPTKSTTSASLLFGTPLVTLGLQVGMLHNNTTWLALSCVVIGLIYAAFALYLRGNEAFKTFQMAYTGLSAGFLTLAVPIGLSAKATSAIFALEGAGAVWLGCREKRILPFMSGVFLKASSVLSFLIAYQGTWEAFKNSTFIVNDRYMSIALIIIGYGVSVWCCFSYSKKEEYSDEESTWRISAQMLKSSSITFFVIAFIFWMAGTGNEVWQFTHELYAVSLFSVLTAGLLVFINRYYDTETVAVAQFTSMLVGLIAIPCLMIAVSNTHIDSIFPLQTWGVTFWLAYACIGWIIWYSMKTTDNVLIDISVVLWLIMLATLITALVFDMLPNSLADTGMYWWAISAVWLFLGCASIRPGLLSPFVKLHSELWHNILAPIVMFILALLGLHAMSLSGGDSRFWIPLVNSVDTLVMATTLLLLLWLLKFKNIVMTIFSYGVAILFVLSNTLRMSHHWGGISIWELDTNTQWNDWLTLLLFGFWVVTVLGLRWLGKKQYSLEITEILQPVLTAFSNTISAFLISVCCGLLFYSGDSDPFTWLPVLNPIAVLQVAIVTITIMLFYNRQKMDLVISVLAILLISVEVLRSVHHFGNTEWSISMFSYALTQMALSIVWSIIGVFAWVTGSVKQNRSLWKLGAILMGIVLVKLVLIDRGHLGNLYGILSFFAYGMLCVIIGYFAPMPPEDESSKEQANTE